MKRSSSTDEVQAPEEAPRSMLSCRTWTELDHYLAEAGGTTLVCIYFSAPWDRPSALSGPILQEIIDQEKDVLFLKAKLPEMEESGITYLVEEFPSFVFVKRKVKIGNYDGENLEAFKQLIEQLRQVIVPIAD